MINRRYQVAKRQRAFRLVAQVLVRVPRHGFEYATACLERRLSSEVGLCV